MQGDTVIAGYLTKQGGARGGFKTWKKRWFVLKQDCLYYYKTKPTNENSEEALMLGVLPLHHAKIVINDGSANDQTTAAIAEASVCHECKKMFTLMTKKTQCKRCQQVFCKTCASCRIAMPSAGFPKPVRVCGACYNIVMANSDSSGALQSSMAIPSRPTSDTGGGDAAVGVSTKLQQHHSSDGRPGQFQVNTPERQLRLRADSEEDMNDWIKHIRACVRRRKRTANKSFAGNVNVLESWEIDYSQLTILDKIGDGAFGEVFKGRLWGTDVAVKTVKNKLTKETLNDLKNEIAILSTLRHPNIVLYIGACTVPPNICIVTEWCDQGSLFDVIYKKRDIIDTKRAIDIASGLAQGINYLHNLDKKIIHRDLKSHNILIDKNYTVKVADFGLSYMRNAITNDNVALTSKGGQYGIFGTPEWMAPEVMEGAPYNEKVDVYSFGVVLTELFARQVPLHDQIKIRTYVDVFEAVLEDGIRPTIPQWIPKPLKNVMTDCFHTNPSKRPTVIQIIARLARMVHKSDRAIFNEYDVPRLNAMLASKRDYLIEIAARELATARKENSSCWRCGYNGTTFRDLDRSDLLDFVAQLVRNVGNRNTNIVRHTCEALLALRNCVDKADEIYYGKWNSKIIESGMIHTLLGCAAQEKDQQLRILSKNIVLELAPDILEKDSQEKALLELNSDTTARFEQILREEMIHLNRELESNRAAMIAKSNLMERLRSILKEQLGTDDYYFYDDDTESLLTSMASMSELPAQFGQTFPAPNLMKIPEVYKLPLPFAGVLSSDANSALCDMCLMYDAASNTWSSAFIVLVNKNIYLYASPETDPGTPLAVLDVSFKIPNHFQASVSTSGMDSNVSSIASNTAVHRQWLKIARKGGKPHCLHIGTEQGEFVFCLRTSQRARTWAHSLAPVRFPGAEAYSMHDKQMAAFDMVEVLKSVPEEKHLANEITSSLKDPIVHEFGWLACWDDDIEIWYPAFVVLYDYTHMRLYEGPRRAIGREIETIDLTFTDSNIPAVVTPDHKKMTTSWSHNIFGITNTAKNQGRSHRTRSSSRHLFAAPTPLQKDHWVASLNKALQQGVMTQMPSLANLKTLPKDLQNVLRKESETLDESSSSQKYSSDEDGFVMSPPRSPTKGDKGVMSSDDETENPQVMPSFVVNSELESGAMQASDLQKAFGKCTMQGYVVTIPIPIPIPIPILNSYLWKRGGFRKNWKLRFFYLVGNELRYFPSHVSEPSEVLGVVYTATASGKQFNVYRDNRKEFGFCIENPSRTWFFAAQREETMHKWIEVLRAPVE